jgi:uncharacterized membrane protein YfcA
MWQPEQLIVIAGTFVLAGLVKGVVGLGLPTVALALLTATIGLHPAIALMLVPSFTTNAWQALSGPALKVLLIRLWSFLLVICGATWFGTMLLARADADLLTAVLGTVLVVYASASLARFSFPSPGRHEPWLSPVMGAANGTLTGMTGVSMIPGLLYLQALGLKRDEFVQALGLMFFVSTVALGFGLGGQSLLTMELGLTSAAAVAPAMFGMWLGRQFRGLLSEQSFRTALFAALLVLGGYIVVRVVW